MTKFSLRARPHTIVGMALNLALSFNAILESIPAKYVPWLAIGGLLSGAGDFVWVVLTFHVPGRSPQKMIHALLRLGAGFKLLVLFGWLFAFVQVLRMVVDSSAHFAPLTAFCSMAFLANALAFSFRGKPNTPHS